MATSPPLVIPDGFSHIALVLKNAASSREALVTFGVDNGGQSANGVANAVHNVILTAGGFKALIGSNTTVNMIKVRQGSNFGDYLTEEKPVSVAGTGGSSKVSSNVAVLIHKRSDQGGRHGRGRMFIPWSVSETNLDEAGYIDAGTVTTLQTAAGAFITGLNSASIPMVILHRLRKDGTISGPAAVQYVLVDNLISTQRRRLGR